MKILVLCLLLAAGLCMAGPPTNNTYGKFYNSLADELKNPFLKYQLALAVVEDEPHSMAKSLKFTDNLLTPEGLGLPEKTFSNLQRLNTPLGFSRQLYDLVTYEMGLSYDDVIGLITKDLVCVGGHCYDFGDVGSHCC